MPHASPLFTVVSFFTADYQADASRLIDSLEVFKIPKHIQRIPTLGSWAANTGYKPSFLLDMRSKYSGPIVWIDCDAIVRKYPHEFDDLADPKKIAPRPVDMAVHYRNGTDLLSGTIYIGDTPAAPGILGDWIAKQIEYPETWDQRTLAATLAAHEDLILVYDLPDTYTFIFDIMRRSNPLGEPVIEHFQSSRRTRRREIFEGNNPFPEKLF